MAIAGRMTDRGAAESGSRARPRRHSRSAATLDHRRPSSLGSPLTSTERAAKDQVCDVRLAPAASQKRQQVTGHDKKKDLRRPGELRIGPRLSWTKNGALQIAAIVSIVLHFDAEGCAGLP